MESHFYFIFAFQVAFQPHLSNPEPSLFVEVI